MSVKLDWNFKTIDVGRRQKHYFDFGRKYRYFVRLPSHEAPGLETFMASNKKLTPKQAYKIWITWCRKEEAKEAKAAKKKK